MAWRPIGANVFLEIGSISIPQKQPILRTFFPNEIIFKQIRRFNADKNILFTIRHYSILFFYNLLYDTVYDF